MAGNLELRALMSACVHLARQGGCVIRDVRQSGQLGEHNKKVLSDVRAVEAMPANEVLTVADCRAQAAIIGGLRAGFPRLRLVGEEGEVASEPAEAPDPEPVEAALAGTLPEADTCVWIDPLDGTKEFVLGNLENVSVLIGVAVRDRPVAGVMFQPFVGGRRGTVTYGAVGAGVFGDRAPAAAGPPEELVVVTNPSGAEEPRIRAALARLGARVVLSHACGQKLLRVLRSEASALVMGAGPSRWDSCAGEALLLAVGGKVTDLDGRPYQYVEGGDYANSAGIIAARTEAIHARIAEAFADPGSPDPPAKRPCSQGAAES